MEFKQIALIALKSQDRVIKIVPFSVVWKEETTVDIKLCLQNEGYNEYRADSLIMKQKTNHAVTSFPVLTFVQLLVERSPGNEVAPC